ncbi:hypothetical protein DVH24_004998 [Malus domestica]|uniref:Reverse transcriptase zinc-binding domain-containing protein n=1 Tax=Malus domestica TaxID=3750 RepID=A0A498IG26_MALDO|nr:hypothetical protein DVH24_004998 [Malus domestica]
MAAWRIISNIIPTEDNLHKWHISLDPACILCGAVSEMVWHIMIECSWLASSLRLRLGQHYGKSMYEWALAMVNEVRSSDFECILKSKALGETTSHSPSVVVRCAFDWWQEYLMVNCRPPLPRRHALIQKWYFPPPGKLKLNVDGA